jgi:minichromosome maintenance protein 10
MCEVKKRDGKVCGSWCDKRQSEVCEYHIQAAVQHRRAGRAEFSVGTGGMTSSSVVKRKHDYDPKRKWGLEPSASTGVTYIVSGHVVRGDNSTSSLFVSENMGREGQARAQRKMANDQTEKQLKKMLERDRDGMEAVLRAREAVQKADSVKGKGVAKPSEGGSKKKEKAVEESAVEELNKPKKAYSASIVRSLGFDPTHKPGQRRVEVTEDTENKVSLIVGRLGVWLTDPE